MNASNVLVWVSVSVLSLILMTSIPQTTSAQPGPVLQDFSLTDIHGDTWKLSENNSDATLIMFWATWCPHCKKLFPTIQRIHDTYADRGVKVVAISVFDDGDTTEYVRTRGLTMTVLNDGDELAEQLGVPGTPTVLILDSGNQIVFAKVSPKPPGHELDEALEQLTTTNASQTRRAVIDRENSQETRE